MLSTKSINASDITNTCALEINILVIDLILPRYPSFSTIVKSKNE